MRGDVRDRLRHRGTLLCRGCIHAAEIAEEKEVWGAHVRGLVACALNTAMEIGHSVGVAYAAMAFQPHSDGARVLTVVAWRGQGLWAMWGSAAQGVGRLWQEKEGEEIKNRVRFRLR